MSAMTSSAIKIIPTALTQTSVQRLVQKLDNYQISLYGLVNCNLEPLEHLQRSQCLLMGAYENDALVGIGAILLCADHAEVKRMYVEETHRGRGIAYGILSELENYARYRRVHQVCLETGRLQADAIDLYKRAGYLQVMQYGNRSPNDVSLYFRKRI